MAIKTFTTGEVLTASDTNTFLANAGLVYVAGGTFSSATQFEITGISSSYIYYKAVFSMTSSATAGLQATLYNGATARNSQYYAGVGWAAFDNPTGS